MAAVVTAVGMIAILPASGTSSGPAATGRVISAEPSLYGTALSV
jgi:hypothetical protein